MKSTPPPDILENFQWLHAPVPGPGWHGWASLALGLVLLACVAGYFIRKKHTGWSSFTLPPHEVALEALNALRRRCTEENQREFVIDVSQIMRVYIQARFGVRAPHRSTEEFLREVQFSERLLRDHQEMLRDFSSQCDLVKFARRHVVLEQMNVLLEQAHRFIHTTIAPSATETAKLA